MNAHAFTMPQRIYFAAQWSKQHPEGYFCGDYEADLDKVLDMALSPYSGDYEPFRIFCIEFDPATNLPERTTDVTEDAIRERNKWLREQGREPITQHPASDYYDAAA